MRIIELELKNIRGIKEIALRPNGHNFVVWGGNGSGKSAVVDGIDFLLTGGISRLTGQGTGSVSLKRHGAHVDCHELSEACVRAIVQLNGLSAPVTISRSLDKPNEVSLSADVGGVFSRISEIAARGQHVLTRREILRFITAEPGKRAEDIQNLMNLADVEEIRKAIGRVVGTYDKALSSARKNAAKARSELSARAGVPEYDARATLLAVNDHRSTLGGAAVSELNSSTLKSNVAAPVVVAGKQDVNISRFEQELENIETALSGESAAEIRAEDESLRRMVAVIHEDASTLRAFSSQKLVDMGLKLLDESGACPLCDREWAPGELKGYLESKLMAAQGVQLQADQVQNLSESLVGKILVVQSSVARVLALLPKLELRDAEDVMSRWLASLQELETALEEPLTRYHKSKWTAEETQRLVAPVGIAETIGRIRETAKSRYPRSTPEQAAWDALTELIVELRKVEDRDKELKDVEVSHARSVILQREFERARDDILNALYDSIKDRFVELYRELHGQDELGFEATLRPSGAALDFEVDFYGRGRFPPNALHSEGHQDSMGVCLFLALSERLTENLLDLVVLDDVVMSVDAEHRRRFCDLVAKQFTNKQFLITTHDRTWALQLSHHGVVEHDGLVEFFDWNVDSGPRVNEAGDLWGRIDGDLRMNDVPSAAQKLRRGSEQFFAEVCSNLGAPVPFRIDGRYELGDLRQSAIGQFRKLLSDARRAHASWHRDPSAEIELLDAGRLEAYKHVSDETWAVSINIHFNELVNFEKNDFVPVVEAYKELFSLFTCPRCHGMIKIVREERAVVGVRCTCNYVNWNLKAKPVAARDAISA